MLGLGSDGNGYQKRKRNEEQSTHPCYSHLLHLPQLDPIDHLVLGDGFASRNGNCGRLGSSLSPLKSLPILLPSLNDFDFKHNQAIYAISPHGIFPFALGFAVLPELASRVFGEFRPVVATATSLFPFLRTILSWLNSV